MNSLNVLICQNKLTDAYETERRLENMGYSVIAITSNGDDALDLAARLKPDLALIDVDISGELNGIQTAHILVSKLEIPSVYLISTFSAHALENKLIKENLLLESAFGDVDTNINHVPNSSTQSNLSLKEIGLTTKSKKVDLNSGIYNNEPLVSRMYGYL